MKSIDTSQCNSLKKKLKENPYTRTFYKKNGTRQMDFSLKLTGKKCTDQTSTIVWTF